MAQRIEDAVIRGEIDNTVEGKTTGSLWLCGRDVPVVLCLEGDCWRDLAGARLKFSNPQPKDLQVDLLPIQKGLVGDITASRKHRVPKCDLEEMIARQVAGDEVPVVWKNSLYIEWFSEANGRVVIEASSFDLEIMDHTWSMDGDAEQAQKMANLQAMRDFMEVIIARRPVRQKQVERDDEFEWERRLRDSDRLSDAYQEVLEKYMDDPDSEQKEAFVMGWDRVLGAMADLVEESNHHHEDGIEEELWRVQAEEDEEDDEELFKPHPLQECAEDLALRAYDLLRAGEDDYGGNRGVLATSLLTQVAAKLAGALNGTYQREAGYVLAILKRCLSLQNELLGIFSELIEHSDDVDHARALEAFRDEIHLLRGKLTDMRQELKRS